MPNYNSEYTKYLNEYINALNKTDLSLNSKQYNSNSNNSNNTSDIKWISNLINNFNYSFSNLSIRSIFSNLNINNEDILLISIIFFLYFENCNDHLLILFLILILLN